MFTPGRRVNTFQDENELVFMLRQAFLETATPDFIQRCDEAHARRPLAARQTEMRYHRKVRAAVQEAGIDLWG